MLKTCFPPVDNVVFERLLFSDSTYCLDKGLRNVLQKLKVRRLTSGSVHDSLDVKEERSEAHLH